MSLLNPEPLPLRVLLLGATGFIGRHVHAALQTRGVQVVRVRRPRGGQGDPAGAWKPMLLHTMREPAAWQAHLQDIDLVINCVGILRQR